ncbi:MAG: hypothetical protein U0270_21965 [Labilithrix sp.]
MSTLEATELRIRKLRRFAWIVAPVLSIPLSYLIAILRAPGAPWWLGLVVGLAATPFAGVLLSRTLASSVRDLLLARVGNEAERRKRLAEPVSRLTPATTRAALALESGELSHAAALLAGLSAPDRRQPLYTLVTQKKVLVTGDPGGQQQAIAALLAWRSRLRFGIHREIARYHAFVLASALAGRAVDDPSVVAAARRLRADRDFEIRAYATWLEPESPEVALLLAGAALARASGREPLAQILERRSARLGPGEPAAPYRAG